MTFVISCNRTNRKKLADEKQKAVIELQKVEENLSKKYLRKVFPLYVYLQGYCLNWKRRRVLLRF